ncbi:MAG: putative peptidoglycan glycosyltransferase FtsW, partial [Patescibacteria group bacterium]
LHGFLPGIILFFLFLNLDYRNLKRFSKIALVFSVGLLVLVFIPGLGTVYNKARSWVSLGFFSFQPSEIVKLTFLIFLAAWFEARREREVRDFMTGLFPFLAALGVIAGLIMLQPDMGTMGIIFISSFVVYFAAGAPLAHIAGIGGLGIAAFFIMIKVAPYRVARFTTFLHPALDPQNIGYQINQALLAIGSGGILGLGYGQSRQKFLYLPQAYGDSIFAVMAEEMGFIFLLFFFFALAVFFFRGIRIARRAPDIFGRLLATGIISWLMFQALYNIGSMAGILPLTGIPLPFISYGGTALMTTLAAVGILGNISRHA